MEKPITGMDQEGRLRGKVIWGLILALLFVRIPGLAGISTFSQPDWLGPAYQLSTYLLTALFLAWEVRNLKDYHIDALALAIVVLFKPLQTVILAVWGFDGPLALPDPISLAVWSIALGLGIYLWIQRRYVPKFEFRSLGWVGIGILAGVGAVLVSSVLIMFQVDPGLALAEYWHYFKLTGMTSFLYQVGYAAVSEEPLFRGFLWGALRKAGWKEVWIWLFQAGLFMLAHIYYLPENPFLFINVFTSALILGAVAWKGRTISASMAAHGVLNALGLLTARLAAYYLR